MSSCDWRVYKGRSYLFLNPINNESPASSYQSRIRRRGSAKALLDKGCAQCSMMHDSMSKGQEIWAAESTTTLNLLGPTGDYNRLCAWRGAGVRQGGLHRVHGFMFPPCAVKLIVEHPGIEGNLKATFSCKCRDCDLNDFLWS